jgi:hypothetical protein
MMMRMSKGFGARWTDERMEDTLATVVLQPRLRALVGAPLVRRSGSLVLEPLVANATGPEAFQDRTGYEAFVNKVHVDDLLDDAGGAGTAQLEMLVRQGARAAVELSRRLESEGKYRVLLSLDPDLPTMTLRFFERRDGEPWARKIPMRFNSKRC